MDNIFSLVRGYNLVIREYGNGIAAPLCAVLVWVLAGFLWRLYKHNGSFFSFRHTDGAQTACLLWWLLLAEGLRAFFAYIPLNAANDEQPLSQLTLDIVSLGFAVSIAILVAVLIRAIFEFQAPGRIPMTVAASVVIVAAFLWFTN